jgi:hypothetical protein
LDFYVTVGHLNTVDEFNVWKGIFLAKVPVKYISVERAALGPPALPFTKSMEEIHFPHRIYTYRTAFGSQYPPQYGTALAHSIHQIALNLLYSLAKSSSTISNS